MVWVWNAILNYEQGGETSFPSMCWRRNVSLNNGANWLWGENYVYPQICELDKKMIILDSEISQYWYDGFHRVLLNLHHAYYTETYNTIDIVLTNQQRR